jgi:hypothetical protein
LYRFLRRAPAVLAMTRAELSYGLERLLYDGGLDYVEMCRLVCAVPELLPAAAERQASPAAAPRSGSGPECRTPNPDVERTRLEVGKLQDDRGGGPEMHRVFNPDQGATDSNPDSDPDPAAVVRRTVETAKRVAMAEAGAAAQAQAF